MVCPPLTGRNATKEVAKFVAATSVAPAAGCHNVLEVAVEAGDTRHEWVTPVEGTQCEWIEHEILGVVVRVVVTTRPSAVDSVWRAGPYIAKPVLHDYPTSIHVVRQIVTKRIRVDEREIAERHNDVVLLEFSQSGRADHGIEEVYRDHIGFGKDFGLQLRGQTRIRIDDEHLERTGSLDLNIIGKLRRRQGRNARRLRTAGHARKRGKL